MQLCQTMHVIYWRVVIFGLAVALITAHIHYIILIDFHHIYLKILYWWSDWTTVLNLLQHLPDILSEIKVWTGTTLSPC